MYFLIFIPKATGGTGFGVFAAVFLSVAFLIGGAIEGPSWLAAPFMVASALAMSQSLWWLLLIIAGIGVAVNLFACKLHGGWHPLAPYIGTWCILIVLFVALIVTGETAEWRWWEYLLAPIAGALFSIFVYPFGWLLTTISALPAVVVEKEYALGAVCSFFGLLFGVFALQGAVELFADLLQIDSLKEVVAINLKLTEAFDLSMAITQEKQSILMKTFGQIGEGIACIPAGVRFLLGATLCGGCGFGEYRCSDGAM